MKKLISLLLIFLGMCLQLGGSITLDPTLVQQTVLGGSTTETDSVAAITDMQIDFKLKIIRFRISFGTLPSEFVPGINAKDLILTADGVKGRISFSDGRPDQVLTGPQQAAIVSYITAQRNAMESRILNLGILLGTQVNW